MSEEIELKWIAKWLCDPKKINENKKTKPRKSLVSTVSIKKIDIRDVRRLRIVLP
jgi:hypothetical protein